MSMYTDHLQYVAAMQAEIQRLQQIVQQQQHRISELESKQPEPKPE